MFNLNLDSVWRNETTIDGVLTESEFEMMGDGTVSLYDNSDGDMYVNVTVLDALINRSMSSGMVSEEFSISGFGELSMNQEEEDSSTSLEGVISLFKLEYYDVNGVSGFYNASESSALEVPIDFRNATAPITEQ